jgi:3',5'-cyclic AMP phosphodiesterase CpdA
MSGMNRRDFLKSTSALVAACSLPMSLIEIAHGKSSKDDFKFAFISDSHITHLEGTKFVRNWDQGLIRAVAEANLMTPRPDFTIYGGDLAQLGTKEELDHGMEIMSGVRGKVYYVLGEHDFYVDLGKYWEEVTGSKQYYSFDHKGVHFVVLNSILTYPEWMDDSRWENGMARMKQMARLDNPHGSPFMVGEKQRKWLKKDLSKVSKDTPIVVMSHSPLQKIYKGWNFWTEDAEQVQAILKPFRKVTVLYGHVHQIQYNQIGNISFNSAMATAWPWPYPDTYVQEATYLPKLTVKMNRADPFQERDATGWQFINLDSGHADLHYTLPNNTNRVVAFNRQTGRPEDTVFQKTQTQLAAQEHY